MDAEPAATPLTERKVVRRGLLAGLAGLGAAAMLKVTGSSKASAANGEALIIGNTNNPAGMNNLQSATNATELRVSATEIRPALIVQKNNSLNFGSSHAIVGANFNGTTAAIRAFNGSSGRALEANTATGGANAGPAIVATGSNGIRGISSDSAGIGVQGVSSANSGAQNNPPSDGAGTGVHGKTGSGLGVKGEAQSGTGVRGESQTAAGVSGGSPGAVGVAGFSDSGVGVRGLSVGFVGAVGVSTLSIGLFASNSAQSVPALFAENLAGSNRVAGVFNGNVVVNGNFTVSGGAKAAAVTMPDGTQAMMYCQESPEPYFEDFGRAQLVGGVAQVLLEPEFASLVHRENYFVYLTPEGESNGLYVSRRDQRGFEVREQKGGSASTSFAYRVVAKRRDIPGVRLERLDPQVTRNVAAMRAIAPSKLSVSPDPLMRGPGGGPPVTPGPVAPAPSGPGPIVPGAGVPGPSAPSGGGPGSR